MAMDAEEVIVPYISYITLGIVALIMIIMILFKVAARDNRFLSNSELYIYSRPEINQRKKNANKQQHKNAYLTQKFADKEDSIPSTD